MAAAETVRVNRAGMEAGLLAPGQADTAGFDLPAWRRELARAWSDEARRNLDYGDSAGLPALRESTVRWLALTRGLRTTPEQVLIVHGPTQALELVSRVLFEPGQTVCVEEPSFVGAPRILAMAGLRVVSAPLDGDGFHVAAARARHARPAGIYVNPQNQFPTTRWTTLQRRRELLAWAHEADAWVIESDYVNEIVFGPAVPPPPLQGLDEDDRVLHTGSWNMTMFPSLRIGWLVLPLRLVPLFRAVRGLYGDHVNVAHQAALAGFIDSGALSRRVRDLHQRLAERRDALFDAARRRLPAGLALEPMRGGATACLRLPPAAPDVQIAAAAAAAGVPVEALSDHAWEHPGVLRGLVLGIGHTPLERIDEGVARLAEVLGGPNGLRRRD
jgi:GntR family transcriptional regulator/MocR family aminotransferase